MKILEKFFCEDLFIKSMLFFALLLLLSKFLEIGLTGDDPFIYMDAFRKGSIIKASILQAIGQGRFWLISAWTLTQLPYFFDNLLFTNIIKILITLGFFASFFKLIKNFFGGPFSYLVCFVGLMILNIAGGDFCPLINSPLWYLVGGIAIIWSFIVFDIELKNNRSHIASSLLFLFGILFYEIFILYAVAFIFIRNRYYQLNKRFKNIDFREYLHPFYWLTLVLLVYLVCYIFFAYSFPSQYVNTQKLEMVSITRSLETIFSLSSNGVAIFDIHPYRNISTKSFTYTVLITLILSLGLFKSTQNLLKDKNKFLSSNTINNKTICALFFFTVMPNLLYGFLDYYHGWKYYVGTFFSALALITLISILFARSILKIGSISHWAPKTFLFFLFIFSTNNFHVFFNKFEELNLNYLKQGLVKSLAPKVKEYLFSGDIICSHHLISEKKDSYEIYDFWSTYLYAKTGKSVKVVDESSTKICDATIYIEPMSDGAKLIFISKDNSIKLELIKENLF